MRHPSWILLAGLVLTAQVLGGWDWFLNEVESVEEGNKLYFQREYAEALKKYDNAENDQGSHPEIHFNKGATLAGQGNHKDAMEEYLKALSGADDTLKARNYYNMGNALLAQKKLTEAIDSYKRSLRLHPGDRDAVFNLELALRIKKQIEEEQKKQQEQQKQDGQQNDQQNDQQNEEGQQQQGDQQNQQENSQNKEDGQDRQDGEQKPNGDEQQEQQQGENDQANNEPKQEQQQGEQGQDQQGKQEQQQQQTAQAQAGEAEEDKQDETGKEQATAMPLNQDEKDKLEQTLDALQDREKSFQMQRFFVPRNAPTLDQDW